MEDIRRLWTVLALAILNCTGVVAPSPELVGLAVSGSISFVLLFFVVFMIGVSFSWSSWMRQWMRARGKVRMPKAYFKKKEEMKRRLLSGAASYTSGPGSVANGSLPAQTVDRDPPWWRSTRYLLAALASFGYGNFFFQRIDLSMAIVCMVNTTAVDIVTSQDEAHRDLITDDFRGNWSMTGGGGKCRADGCRAIWLVVSSI